jgi:hypothetical protein
MTPALAPYSAYYSYRSSIFSTASCRSVNRGTQRNFCLLSSGKAQSTASFRAGDSLYHQAVRTISRPLFEPERPIEANYPSFYVHVPRCLHFEQTSGEPDLPLEPCRTDSFASGAAENQEEKRAIAGAGLLVSGRIATALQGYRPLRRSLGWRAHSNRLETCPRNSLRYRLPDRDVAQGGPSGVSIVGWNLALSSGTHQGEAGRSSLSASPGYLPADFPITHQAAKKTLALPILSATCLQAPWQTARFGGASQGSTASVPLHSKDGRKLRRFEQRHRMGGKLHRAFSGRRQEVLHQQSHLQAAKSHRRIATNLWRLKLLRLLLSEVICV